MSRIDATFAALKRQGRKALIPYVTAGDPFADATPEIMQAMAQAGADVIELGVPFSDPMADGPVIQKASERALARGVGMSQVLAIVRQFRSHNSATPVVLMGYANPVERYGIDRFVADDHTDHVSVFPGQANHCFDLPLVSCLVISDPRAQGDVQPVFCSQGGDLRQRPFRGIGTDGMALAGQQF